MGAITDTVKDISGNLYFADDRGFSRMLAGQYPGTYSLRNIGKNVYETFIENRENITTSAIDRDKLRYYLFYTDSTTFKSGGLVFTFTDSRLKGATKLSLPNKIICSTEGTFTDGTNKTFLGASNGYVYQMFKGTSFDGLEIETSFTTSYYGYGSNRAWKHFKRIGFEIEADHRTIFKVRSRYDYQSPQLPTPSEESQTLTEGSGIWDTSEWDSFTWANDVLSTAIFYIQGYGTSMAISLRTNSKYKSQHKIYNITTDFTTGPVRQ
jgi:hypothetical protein